MGFNLPSQWYIYIYTVTGQSAHLNEGMVKEMRGLPAVLRTRLETVRQEIVPLVRQRCRGNRGGFPHPNLEHDLVLVVVLRPGEFPHRHLHDDAAHAPNVQGSPHLLFQYHLWRQVGWGRGESDGRREGGRGDSINNPLIETL